MSDFKFKPEDLERRNSKFSRFLKTETKGLSPQGQEHVKEAWKAAVEKVARDQELDHGLYAKKYAKKVGNFVAKKYPERHDFTKREKEVFGHTIETLTHKPEPPPKAANDNEHEIEKHEAA